MFLKPHRIHLHFGLKKPVKILQITDAHFCLAHENDSYADINVAIVGRRGFNNEANYPERDPLGFFEEAMEYSKEFDCTVLTGDIINNMTKTNLEVCEKVLSGKNYMACFGNHEFCTLDFTEEKGFRNNPDSFDRKNENMDMVQSYFHRNMVFDSRVVGEVNVITMDNGYFVWTKEQFELLKREVSRGLPILLFTHVPLTCSALHHNPTHSDLPVSEEEVEFTRSVTKYIIEEPLIKGIFSGHWHCNMTETLGEKTIHILGGLFKGIVGEIIID